MSVAEITPPRPSITQWLSSTNGVIWLLVLMWVPLTIHVIAGDSLGAAKNLILLPAIPATVILYIVAVRAFHESWVAILGTTLVFFWLLMAVSAPFLPLLDPNKPIAPFAAPFTEKRDVFFMLGSDFKGRDLLSRVIFGCQRVLVWGVSATVVAYIIGSAMGLVAGYLSGWWDEIISFIGNVLLSFPVMVLFILILNYLGPSGLQHHRGGDLRVGTGDHAYRARARPRHQDARLRFCCPDTG